MYMLMPRRLIFCLLLNLFSNASDALRAARADGRLGRVINMHTRIGYNKLMMAEMADGCKAANCKVHHRLSSFSFQLSDFQIISLLRGEPSKNEMFWAHSDPWRIFSTSSRGL